MPYFVLTSRDIKYTEENPVRPIAIVVAGRGNPYDGKILYCHEGFTPMPARPESPRDTIAEHIELPVGCTFQVLPSADEKARQTVYCFGASGSGKSHWTAQYARAFLNLHPTRKCYVISAQDEDPVVDELPRMHRIDIASLVTDPIPSNEVCPQFKDSIVIADDADSTSKQEYAAILGMLNAIATRGRHTNTTLVTCLHKATDYSRSTVLLNEAQLFVVFPHGSSFHALRYMLREHVGLSDDQIRGLRKLGSRWVCLSARAPRWLIAEHTARIMD
jgi:hypothetical protein